MLDLTFGENGASVTQLRVSNSRPLRMHRIAPYNNYSTTRLRSNRGVTMIKRETGSRTTHAIEPLTINRNVQTCKRQRKEKARERERRSLVPTGLHLHTHEYTHVCIHISISFPWLPEAAEGIFFSRSPLGRVTRIYVSPVSLSAERASLIKRLRDETGSDVLPSARCSFAARICLRHSCCRGGVKLSDF